MTVVNTTDLAAKLGLTRVTVSRAINNDPRVASKTRERVLQAMQEHCLQPNAVARSLVKGRTMTIGLAVGDLRDDYVHELMEGLEPVLEADDYSVLMGVSKFKPAREQSRLSAMLAQRVEGIVSQPLPENREFYERLTRQHVPIVFMADYLDIPGVSWVVSDPVADSRTAMKHLLDLGHRRIAFIGPKSISAQIQPRAAIYRQMLREAGIGVSDSYIYEGQLGGRDDVYHAVHRMVQLPQPPTAFFAAVDLIGVYVMDQLVRDGFRVPADISVVSIGDTMISRLEMISLTTVAEDRRDIGERAGQTMLKLIRNELTQPCQTFVPGQLIVRRTTARVV
jgi:LacI family transcriptional regulator